MDTVNNIVRKLRENRILNEREDYNEKSRDELISLAKEGDQLAIETLMSTHKDFLGRMRAKYVMDNWDKDDIEQITMIAFWEAIQSYDPEKNGDFEAYAGMVIKRRLTDELRKEGAGKRQINTQAKSLDDTQSDGEGSESTFGDTIADTGLTPEEVYSSKEATQAILRFMREKLSEIELEVVQRKMDGDKVSKIAEETGMKYKSVENALMRVKNKLAEYMRSRESKKLKAEEIEESVEFSEEEKTILKNALSQMDKEPVRESVVSYLKESYENYTESQLESELDSIEEEVDAIATVLPNIHPEEREDISEKLDDMLTKLSAMEEFLPDDLYEKYDELYKKILRTTDIEYKGERISKYDDSYKSRGLSRAEFR